MSLCRVMEARRCEDRWLLVPTPECSLSMQALNRSLDRRPDEEEYVTQSTLILIDGSHVQLVTVVDMFN
jgi:hypothetical protein